MTADSGVGCLERAAAVALPGDPELTGASEANPDPGSEGFVGSTTAAAVFSVFRPPTAASETAVCGFSVFCPVAAGTIAPGLATTCSGFGGLALAAAAASLAFSLGLVKLMRTGILLIRRSDEVAGVAADEGSVDAADGTEGAEISGPVESEYEVSCLRTNSLLLSLPLRM